MKGPVAKLFSAGAEGKHQNNIRRDWFRRMANMKFDHRVPKLKDSWGIYFCLTKCWKTIFWEKGILVCQHMCFVGAYIMGGCSTYGVWTRWLDSDYRVTWCDMFVRVGLWSFNFHDKTCRIDMYETVTLDYRSDEEHALLSPWSSSTMADRSQHLARHLKQEDQTILESYEKCWFRNWGCEPGWRPSSNLDLGWCCQLCKGS